MARPAKQPDERRTFLTGVRWTAEELARLEAKTQAAGLERAEFIRRATLGRRLVANDTAARRALPPDDHTALRRLGLRIDAALHAAHIHRRLPEEFASWCDRWQFALALIVPDGHGLNRDAAFQIERIGHNLVQLARLAEQSGGAMPALLHALSAAVDRLLREVAGHGA